MLSLAQNYLTRGFWGDEAWTSLISQLPYKDMLKTTAADFHPPAYYSIIELVYKFLPPTEIVTRSVSIIFYLLTLFLVWKLASEIKGKLFGVVSTLVVALNPIFFTYAFEARNYTMFAFAAVGSVYCLIKLSVLSCQLSEKSQSVSQLTGQPRTEKPESDNRKQKTDNWKFWAAGFVFFSTLGIYTHYYMFFTLAAQGLYLLLFDRKIFIKMMGLYSVVGFLYLPWVPFLYHQLTSVKESYWIGQIDKRTHYEALLRILGGEHKNAFRPFLFGLSVALLTIGIVQHALRQKFEKPYLLIWLWAVVPFTLASLPGLKIEGFQIPFRPIFFWRYLINASVPLTMVSVHAAQRFPKYVFITSCTLIIFLSAAINFLTFFKYPYGFKQVYDEKVLDRIKAGDTIVTVLPSFAEVMYYRMRNNLKNDLVVLPEGLVQFSGKSLLDAYVASGAVTIKESVNGAFFYMTPGPNVKFLSD